MKIYTRGGDHGETGLIGGQRVAKDSTRVEVCGTLDELSAMLGLARAASPSNDVDDQLDRLQNELGFLMSEVADSSGASGGIQQTHVDALEQTIDRLDRQLPPLTAFILPGGSRPAAVLHVARTVCRRAERRLATLARGTDSLVSPRVLAYVNRLSDLLFVLARTANAELGQPDELWRKDV